MLSDDAIQSILKGVLTDQYGKIDSAAFHFFEHQRLQQVDAGHPYFHKWVVADVGDTDSEEVVRSIAVVAVSEIVQVSQLLMSEFVFGTGSLLPTSPMWIDGSPLFSETSADANKGPRFGVLGGNVIKSSQSPIDDMRRAVDRLRRLAPDGHEDNERLNVFCHRSQVKHLIKAGVRAGANCRVFGIKCPVRTNRWVLTREPPSCSLMIGPPAFELSVTGNRIVTGAKFVVWINDPRLAVLIEPRGDDE